MAALDTIKRSLRMIGVLAEGETPSAAQAQDALDSLNGMVAAWEGEGVRLNMAPLTLATAIPLPASHLDAIAYNLALRLAPEYGATERMPVLAVDADRLFRALQAAYANPPVLTVEPELSRPMRRRWGY